MKSKNIKKLLLAAVLAVLALGLFVGCGSTDPEEALVGTWEYTGGSQDPYWHHYLVFTEGGRFMDNDGDWGDFIIDGNRITFAFDHFFHQTFEFRISGRNLTLSEVGSNNRNQLPRLRRQ